MRTLTVRPAGEAIRLPAVVDWPRALVPGAQRRRAQTAFATLDVLEHLEAAVQWIIAAHTNSGDGGIAAYYDLLRGRWRRSYPETTGYTIPTLFECARRLHRADLADLAVRLADYLLQVRTPEGGVGHWNQQPGRRVTPIVFDTGQVIFGWLSTWRETGLPTYLEAAIRAADWLVSVQSPSGAWYRNQHLDAVKVIDVRVAWSLLEVARATDVAKYERAAVRNLEWASSFQLANGWFRHAGFSAGEDPFTHTIAYTAEGLLEAGLMLPDPTYVAAAERVARVLLQQQHADGSLASTYNQDWAPTSRSTCLTGNCQIGLLWMRLFEISGDPAYLEAAERAVAFVARTQDLQTTNPRFRGAIAGSLPLYGPYERMKYPNWAAKFFIDSLLSLEKLRGSCVPRSSL